MDQSAGPHKVFIAGFPYEMTEQELREHLKPYAKVLDVKVIFDRDGKPKGFAFVEVGTADQAKALIRQLDGSYIGTRKLFVNEYRAKAGDERPPKREYPGAGAPAAPPPGPPGGVERRSGFDRRKNVGEPGGPRQDRRAFGDKKPWGKRPYGEKKPWGDKKPFGDKKPWGEKKPWQKDKPGFGEKKPWQKDKPSFGEKKPWQKDRPGFGEKKPWQKDKPSFGEKKPWQKDKPGFGEKKPWGERKPGGFGENKKPWVKKPGFGKKPFGKPGGFRKPRPE